MNNPGARIGILAAFGAVCALALVVALNLSSSDQTAPPNTAPVSARREPLNNDAPEPARADHPSMPSSGSTRPPESRAPESGQNESATLRDLFLPGKTDTRNSMDSRQIVLLLRDHIETNHPRLRLSDDEVETLAESMKTFREAKAKMNSLERTGANAAALHAALQDVNSAAETFTEIVGMPPGEFFMTEDAPVSFGRDGRADGDKEIVSEYLSDYKP